MRLLGLDLAWTGTTGWVVWEDDRPIAWGDFKPPYKKLPHAQRIAFYSHKLHLATLNLIRDHQPDFLVYEKTDWHRGPGRVNQAIERRNRAALARAETIVILTADQEGVSVMPLGANEAKAEFGAKRKDAIARLIVEEYPCLFEFSTDGDSCYLVYRETGERLSHHISDAMALVKVAAARLRQEALVEESLSVRLL